MHKLPTGNRLSDENIAWMKRKLERCKEKHNHEYDISTPAYLPTRLLDIRGDSLRLVNTAKYSPPTNTASDKTKGETYPYAALSYCWGPLEHAALQLRTTTKTLGAHQEQIDANKLTQVVRDAIKTTKALGIPYLWIDALCIIQDNLDDWNFEASMMGSVYANAEVTLCGLASSSCLQGFLTRTRRIAKVNFRSRLRPEMESAVHIRYCGVSPSPRGPFKDFQPLEDQVESEWISRGWTYQEKAMSTRKLWFGGSRTHFLCDSVIHTEGIEPRTPGWDSSVQKDVSHSSQKKVYRDWESHAIFLSRRHFTYNTDTFPALSGIASMFAKALPDDTYVAGLWQARIERQLLWYLRTQDKLPSTLRDLRIGFADATRFIAPSWSWAGRGPIMYEIDEALGTQISGIWSGRRGYREEHKGIQPVVTLKNPHHPYGQLSGGHLLMTGHVCPLPSVIHPSIVPVSRSDVLARKQIKLEGEYLVDCLLDWHPQPISATFSPENVVMILLRSASLRRETLYRRGLPLCSRREKVGEELDKPQVISGQPDLVPQKRTSSCPTSSHSRTSSDTNSVMDNLGDHIRPYKSRKRARRGTREAPPSNVAFADLTHLRGQSGEVITENNKTEAMESGENDRSSAVPDEEGSEREADEDTVDEDDMADYSTESEERSEESFADDDLDDIPQEKGRERICMCKTCEGEWDSDGMRVAYGLLLCHTDKDKNPDDFFRVGVFVSLPIYRGGLGYFKQFPLMAVKIL